ncbi:uncharacterized protein LOC141914241 [Tubulanus polymorphus]|uniref:uncharacterized protein LOC141914241 n=1 Tax=Tubulanus polymorphus TaxID=672921 RepID=UPI003DA2E94F
MAISRRIQAIIVIFLVILNSSESSVSNNKSENYSGKMTISAYPESPIRHGASFRIRCDYLGVPNHQVASLLLLHEPSNTLIASERQVEQGWRRSDSKEGCIDVTKNAMMLGDAGVYTCCRGQACASISISIDVVDLRILPISQVGDPVVVECSTIYAKEANVIKSDIIIAVNGKMIVSGCRKDSDSGFNINVTGCPNESGRRAIRMKIEASDSMEVCCQFGEGNKQCSTITAIVPNEETHTMISTTSKEPAYTFSGTETDVYSIITITIAIISMAFLAF